MSAAHGTSDEPGTLAADSREPATALPPGEFAFPSPDRSWTYHATVLIGSALVLAAACVLSVIDPESVGIPAIGWQVPGTCVSRYLFQSPCPGCGLTRSFVSLAHGDFVQAVRFNPAGPVLFAIFAFQIPFRSVQLWRLQRDEPPLEWPWLNYVLPVTLVLLLAQWLAHMSGWSL